MHSQRTVKKRSIKRVKIDPLDALFSEYIRKRAKGYCQRCSTYHGWKELECCHFHGRALKSVRWDEDNAIAGCTGCHQYLDSQPLIKVEFFKFLLGEERFNMLNSRMRNTHPKPDKNALTLYYKSKLAELRDDE